MIVALVTDLFFSSKIREVARTLEAELQTAREVPALIAHAHNAKLVILDLRHPQAIAALEGLPKTVRCVGFIDHEKEDVIAAARARGCEALARGAMAARLPKLIGDALLAD
jgi:hypothetical protein